MSAFLKYNFLQCQICRTIDDANYDLSPPKEISVVRDKLRVGPYESEQLLCGYYVSIFCDIFTHFLLITH